MPSIDRRTLLAAAGTGSLAALAGCSSSWPDSGEPEPESLVATGDGGRPFDGPAATDWPAPRADPGNTGYAPDAAPPSPRLAVRWRTAVPSTDREDTTDRASAPVVAGDRVVVATGGPRVGSDASPGTRPSRGSRPSRSCFSSTPGPAGRC